MSGTTIGWDNTTPGATDLVGQGDDVIRSTKSNIQGGLDAEHLWPAAGGLSGIHRAGSARVFVGTSSQVSSADTTGRLMFNTTTGQLNYLSSVSSVIVGSGKVLHGPSAGSASVVTQRLGFDMRVISAVTQSTTFNQLFIEPWVEAPQVMLQVLQPSDTAKGSYAPTVIAVNTSGFSYHWGGVQGETTSTCSITYYAVGKIAYP